MLRRTEDAALGSSAKRSRLSRARSLSWLGQTAASLFWIGSMLIYGLESGGDWLQLCAATAWLVANVVSLVRAGGE